MLSKSQVVKGLESFRNVGLDIFCVLFIMKNRRDLHVNRCSQTGKYLPVTFLYKAQTGLLSVLLKWTLLEEEPKDSA